MTHDLISALVLGVVEGITEFIPVSSTGHLIIAGDWLQFTGDRAKTFEIFIQLGAILAVVWLYRDRFLDLVRRAGDPESRGLLVNLFIAFLPAAIVGLLTHHWIKEHLFTPVVVAWALVVGGVLMLLIERRRPLSRVDSVAGIRPATALAIGLAQVLSLIPGVSRSGSTIMGGYALGLSRTAATEFSFLLAVPILAAAAGYDLLKSAGALHASDVPVFAVGLVVSFISALIIVKAFLRYVAHHPFALFAWYRIGFGALLLWFYSRQMAPGS
ncbi:MAG: undecaprenyl-diphosphate phosphatase [Gemmatimonadales bacterium]